MYKEVKMSQVRELVENHAFIIDVREKAEYDVGHLKTAVNIPLSDLNKDLMRSRKISLSISIVVLVKEVIIWSWHYSI